MAADILPTQPVMGIIAVLSFLCNGALCLVVLRNPSMLASSYNVLIFTLAVTDTLTGIFLMASPNYVLGEVVPIPPGAAGQLFCRVIYRGFLVWLFSKFSVSLVTSMAIERWFAIAKPSRYKVLFTNRRVMCYTTGLFLWCLCWVSLILFESPMEVIDSVQKCVFRELITNISASRGWVVTYCVVTVLVPFLITMATYFHLRFSVRRRIDKNQNMRQRKRAELEIKLSRMGVVVAVCMAICFMPNQISYILVKFNVVSILSPGHNVTIVLSMLNSCINPFIYCSTNRVFRKQFARLIFECRKHKVKISSLCEARRPKALFRYRDSFQINVENIEISQSYVHK